MLFEDTAVVHNFCSTQADPLIVPPRFGPFSELVFYPESNRALLYLLCLCVTGDVGEQVGNCVVPRNSPFHASHFPRPKSHSTQGKKGGVRLGTYDLEVGTCGRIGKLSVRCSHNTQAIMHKAVILREPHRVGGGAFSF